MKNININRIEAIREFLKEKIGSKYAVLGISSGIDSSLVLTLLATAIDQDKIKAIFMPDRYTKQEDYDDIKMLSESTGVEIIEVNIENIFQSYRNILNSTDKKIEGNVRSRIRANILYYHANLLGGLVIGTTNRTEYLLGYYTKYGDGACDIEPIEGLYKTDVWDIASIMKIPQSIIDKRPSAGLWEGQYDEEELKMNYREIDRALADIFDYSNFKADYGKLMELYLRSMHKRELPRAMN
ncbi:MAG: NAD+ synthase [Candidatus Thermoplasmatota archaeon]|uniref:NAD+ synthase n=1 Tax=Ferroplasma sp. TaxID=2591003 RepID=UPI000389632C|nr:NAD+ synthase [Ferroplasma sp.]EQB74413.1 MAG: NAD synthetase [Ferroplasma sp. Type II]MCL4312406.1 NAD+ synthase [Candidatus Thermoplasmatota archaeon]